VFGWRTPEDEENTTSREINYQLFFISAAKWDLNNLKSFSRLPGNLLWFSCFGSASNLVDFWKSEAKFKVF